MTKNERVKEEAAYHLIDDNSLDFNNQSSHIASV